MAKVNPKTDLQILKASYWEHFKYAQELASYLDLDHHKRVAVQKELNIMIDKIKELKK